LGILIVIIVDSSRLLKILDAYEYSRVKWKTSGYYGGK
jgi:hypothetical protein